MNNFQNLNSYTCICNTYDNTFAGASPYVYYNTYNYIYDNTFVGASPYNSYPYNSCIDISEAIEVVKAIEVVNFDEID